MQHSRIKHICVLALRWQTPAQGYLSEIKIMKRLSEIEIQKALLSLDGWKCEKDGIIKKFVFANFKDALATMNKIGEVAEEMNHHPEWFNVYNKLNIRLSTHDQGGITQLDIDLAKTIEEIVNN